MTLNKAYDIIDSILKEEHKLIYEFIDIWKLSTIKFERGWVINFQTKEFIEDPVLGLGLTGNNPYLVDIFDMKVYELNFDFVPVLTSLELLEIYLFEKEKCSLCELLPLIKKI